MESKLGKLSAVDLRELWNNEAAEFTPWLAQPENIALLGEAVGIELEVEHTEVAIGPYSADIVAKDVGTGEYVVIENQLGKSDHDHLGKLLTYGSALDASAVIWIVGHLTEEHKKALDWLNDHTTEDLSFIGVEVELWKIGDSSPAVRFNVISKPSEVERKTAIVAAKEGMTDARRLQLEFWTEFEKKLRETRAVPSTQAPRPQYWYDVSLGRSGIHLSNFANTYENRIGLRVYMTSQVADQALEQLLKEKENIEEEIGVKLGWNPYPDKKDKIILLDRPADLAKRDKWPEYLDWLIDHNIKFRKTFGPRVKRLDLARNENKVALDNL